MTIIFKDPLFDALVLTLLATLFWIGAADAEGRKRKYRKGDIGFHHYAFELSSRKDVDELGAFLEKNGMTVIDPPGEYYGENYYAVYFADPDGMKLEGMIWAPPRNKRKPAPRKKAKKRKSLIAESGRHAEQNRSARHHLVAAASLGGIKRIVGRFDQPGGWPALLGHQRLDADADGNDAAGRLGVGDEQILD